MSLRQWSRNRGNVIGDGRRHARMPQRPFGGGGAPPPPPPAFGEACEYVETSNVLGTTSTTYQTHLTLTTPDLPAGDYMVGFRAFFQQNTEPEGDAEVRLIQDLAGVPVTLFEENGHTGGLGVGGDSDPACIFASTFLVTIAQGIHTFDLQVRLDPVGGDPGDDVALYWSCIEFWSFN